MVVDYRWLQLITFEPVLSSASSTPLPWFFYLGAFYGGPLLDRYDPVMCASRGGSHSNHEDSYNPQW
jgi:hypothetical protein